MVLVGPVGHGKLPLSQERIASHKWEVVREEFLCIGMSCQNTLAWSDVVTSPKKTRSVRRIPLKFEKKENPTRRKQTLTVSAKERTVSHRIQNKGQ